MANKLSDILLMVPNTQLRIALEKLAGLCGISLDSSSGSALVTDVTGNLTGEVTGIDKDGWSSVDTTSVDGEDGSATVQFVFKDSDDVAISEPVAGTFYLTTSSAGLTRDAATGNITTLTNGVVQVIDAAVENGWHFVTTAAGLLGMTVVSSEDTYYIVFIAPSGKLTISDAIDITGGG